MAGAQRSGARWIALLLGVALVASAAVAYALIRVTTPTAGGSQALSSTQSTVTASTPVSPADVAVTTSAKPSSPATSTATPSPSPASSTVPPPESSAPGTGASTAFGSATSQSAGSTSGPDAVTTETSMLLGSGVTLPAAWSGTATITVRVIGDCATRTPSVYRSIPADLALDLTQNEVVAAPPTASPKVPDNQPALTLGVNTSGANTAGEPTVAVYSSAVDEAGAFHRYWQILLTPVDDRTQIQGTLIDQAAQGVNLNTVTDTETTLQPCVDRGTVGLPRALATGSTLSGWVSNTGANLTLHATTTDHKRAVTVQISAVRKQ